jgi:cytochrome oxidase Cu insertion factor (SCO1/SenC/PrrC family)
MRFAKWLLVSLALVAMSSPVQAQRKKLKVNEDEFLKEAPGVGDKLPDVTVYSPTGTEFKTADLRGHYTVLTFGCLT